MDAMLQGKQRIPGIEKPVSRLALGSASFRAADQQRCFELLDKFRSFVFDSTFLERFELEQELVDQLRTDDMALMQFGLRWLRYALFAEPTMTVRPDAPSSPRQA